jgi:hypothetical protein
VPDHRAPTFASIDRRCPALSVVLKQISLCSFRALLLQPSDENGP